MLSHTGKFSQNHIVTLGSVKVPSSLFSMSQLLTNMAQFMGQLGFLPFGFGVQGSITLVGKPCLHL